MKGDLAAGTPVEATPGPRPLLPRGRFAFLSGRNAHLAAAAVATGLYTTVHSIIVWPMFAIQGSDFAGHVDLGEAMYRHLRIAEPHFLYHLLIAAMYAIRLAPSFIDAARWIVVGSYALTALLSYGGIWRIFLGHSWVGSAPVVFLATLAGLEAQPIGRFDWYQIGYVWNDPFAIPTYILLRPFAVAAFFLTAAFLFERLDAGRPLLILFFAIVGGGALAKPSFLICFLPAVVILAALRWRRGQPLSLRVLLLGFCLPAFLVLLGQFLETYAGIRSLVGYHDHIVWAPLVVMRHWSNQLGLKFLLSAAFPLAVLVVHWKTALRDGIMQLACLTFAVASFYTYCLSEQINWAAGNFLWSAYISLFLLFIASIIFVLRQARRSAWWRTALCLCTLAPQVISGIAFDRKYLGWALDRIH